MTICSFNCSNVKIEKYFPKNISQKDKIKLILISEASPKNLEDYFDGY
jgi:hypothetical protein